MMIAQFAGALCMVSSFLLLMLEGLTLVSAESIFIDYFEVQNESQADNMRTFYSPDGLSYVNTLWGKGAEHVLFKATMISGSSVSIKFRPSEYQTVSEDASLDVQGGASIYIGARSSYASLTLIDESLKSVLTISPKGDVTGRIHMNGQSYFVKTKPLLEEKRSMYLLLENENHISNDLVFEADAAGKQVSQPRERKRINRALLSVKPWKTKCVEKPYVLNVGIVIGSHLAKVYQRSPGGDVDITRLNNWLQHVLLETNIVYHPLNVTLRLKRLVIWNETEQLDNKNCTWKIYQQYYIFLKSFKPDEVSNINSNISLWHHFDDCRPAGDTRAGQASISTVCDETKAKSVSRVGERNSAWRLFAHEVGHVLGLKHHPNRGIMSPSSANQLVNEQYQLNAKQLDAKECNLLNERLKRCSSSSSSTICGNGILEAGEECECERGEMECRCCRYCKLKEEKDAVCSQKDQCCTNTCQYETAAADCITGDGLNGYCGAFGRCMKSNCDVYTSSFEHMCGHQDGNDCRIKCKPVKEELCSDLSGYNRADISFVKDGSYCRLPDGNVGVCISGQCDIGACQSAYACPEYSTKRNGIPCPKTPEDCVCFKNYIKENGKCVDGENVSMIQMTTRLLEQFLVYLLFQD